MNIIRFAIVVFLFAIVVWPFPPAFGQDQESKQADANKPSEDSAELYIQRWKNPLADMYARGELPPAEAEKVVAFLRAEFPFQSLRGRLEYESRSRLNRHSQMHTTNEQLDQAPDSESLRSHYMRVKALERLHSDKAAEFIASEGFGLSRIRRESPYDLRRFDRGEIALDSEYHSAAEFATDKVIEFGQAESHPDMDNVKTVHESATTLFADPAQHGLVRNLDEVAGFEPHALTEIPRSGIIGQKPEGEEQPIWWKINRLELVGLLKHEHFVVYETDKLPDMEKLGEAPKRKLNDFEVESLGQLFRGKNLVATATTNRIRMLGALRATGECLDCHSVKEGELLGAFSYELLRQPRLERVEKIELNQKGSR